LAKTVSFEMSTECVFAG